MSYQIFIGVDVSKETLDFVVLVEGTKRLHQQVSNDRQGIKSFYQRLKQEVKVKPADWLFCLEHTGVYCNPLLNFAASKQLAVWLEDARKINAYHGLAREKNDAADALKIAYYAYAKRDQIKRWQPPRTIISQLKALLKLRERLLASKKRLQDPLREEERFADPAWVKEHQKMLRPVVAQIDRQLKEIEQKIEHLIRQDDHLKKLYSLITSVKGVGLVVAINTLIVTNEFKAITDPRKMACHCGPGRRAVAPFQQQSGKSVRGRAKVSHQANKPMKTLLHLAARAAVATEGELQDYYLRKVAEGHRGAEKTRWPCLMRSEIRSFIVCLLVSGMSVNMKIFMPTRLLEP